MNSDATVRDVITREYVGVSESDSVRGTVQLMREEQASSVLVLRGNDAVGIMTEWDVLGLVADGGDPAETTAAEVMSSPVESVPADTPLTEAAGMMSGESIRNLLVTEDAETLGVLTDRDVIAAVASLQRTRDRDREYGFDPAGEPARDPAEGNGVDTGVGTNEVGDQGVSNAAFVTQGVCEVCGGLSETLYDTNGQLVCPDCQKI